MSGRLASFSSLFLAVPLKADLHGRSSLPLTLESSYLGVDGSHSFHISKKAPYITSATKIQIDTHKITLSLCATYNKNSSCSLGAITVNMPTSAAIDAISITTQVCHFDQFVSDKRLCHVASLHEPTCTEEQRNWPCALSYDCPAG